MTSTSCDWCLRNPYNRGYDDAEFAKIQLIYQELIKRQLIAV